MSQIIHTQYHHRLIAGLYVGGAAAGAAGYAATGASASWLAAFIWLVAPIALLSFSLGMVMSLAGRSSLWAAYLFEIGGAMGMWLFAGCLIAAAGFCVGMILA